MLSPRSVAESTSMRSRAVAVEVVPGASPLSTALQHLGNRSPDDHEDVPEIVGESCACSPEEFASLALFELLSKAGLLQVGSALELGGGCGAFGGSLRPGLRDEEDEDQHECEDREFGELGRWDVEGGDAPDDEGDRYGHPECESDHEATKWQHECRKRECGEDRVETDDHVAAVDRDERDRDEPEVERRGVPVLDREPTLDRSSSTITPLRRRPKYHRQSHPTIDCRSNCRFVPSYSARAVFS